jgi:GT2 family glycosyltransferase
MSLEGEAEIDSLAELSDTLKSSPSIAFSIVILTYNRNTLLDRLLLELRPFQFSGAEIVVVDNASATPAEEVTCNHPGVRVIRAAHNLGAAGRNLGFSAANGEFVICLDDDISKLSADALPRLGQIFADSCVGAVNFQVRDERTDEVVNWVHHRSQTAFANLMFDTYEITEGAVAFRRSVLASVGGYPASFFLSHEGPDLAFRIWDSGSRVIYTPTVSVCHSFAEQGRTSWRNYYYDTRNTFWLAARHLPWSYGSLVVTRQTLAMLLYSARDGYLKWWARGIWHGLKGLPAALHQRRVLARGTMDKLRAMDAFRPSVLSLLRQRLSQADIFRL